MSQFIEVLLEGGSRSGKTFIAIYAIIARCLQNDDSRHLIVRRHFNHVKQSIWYQTIPVVLKIAFSGVRVKDNRSDWFLEFENGSQIWIAGTDDKERIEKILGSEWDTIYINEASQVPFDTYETLKTRLNPAQDIKPLLLIDYNPPSMNHWGFLIFHKGLNPETRQPLSDKTRYAMIRMNPLDNVENLSADYIKTLESMSESKQRRFLRGEYSDDSENALWERKWITEHRISDFEQKEKVINQTVEKIVVGVDPAVTGNETSDDTGIMIVGKGYIGEVEHYFVLEDRTFHGGVTGWGQEVCKAYADYHANYVVAEVNNGGDLVEVNIRNYDRNINYESVRASKGKAVRAEPVADLYRRGLVHHVGNFMDLEDQMCTWTEESGEASPNNMDALVWAISYLSGIGTSKLSIIKYGGNNGINKNNMGFRR